MRLYADDAIVYKEINSINDHKILHEDLDTLLEWTTTWLMTSIFVYVPSSPLPSSIIQVFFYYAIFGNTLVLMTMSRFRLQFHMIFVGKGIAIRSLSKTFK